MTITRDDIATRFVEAAETEHRLPFARVAPEGMKTFWPEFRLTWADLNGYGGDRLLEVYTVKMPKIPPTAAAISRHDKCLVWTVEIIRERDRKLVWAWAFSQARGRGFKPWCRANGIVPQTAYNRINRAFDDIIAELHNQHELLSAADEITVGPIAAPSDIEDDMVGDRMGGAGTHWRADDAIPTPRPDMWERRKISEAKRRALLGVG